MRNPSSDRRCFIGGSDARMIMGNDHGSMNFASKIVCVLSMIPSSVAAIHRFTGCCTCRWILVIV